MTVTAVVEIGKNALVVATLTSMPMLLAGLITGLIIAVFQTTTSIQEQTLSFIPKLFAVFVAVVAFGPWIIQTLMTYTARIFSNLHTLM